MKYFIIALCISVFGCDITGKLKYKDDTLLSSGYTRAPVAFAKINGKPCKSMGDEIGRCYPGIQRGKDIIIEIPEHPYSYNFMLICTSSLNINKTVTVLKDRAHTEIIKADKFSKILVPTCDGQSIEADVFNCEGHIFPLNTSAEPRVSKFFSARFAVYSSDYRLPPEITIQDYKGNSYVVYGENALYGEITEDGKKKSLNKDTYIKIKNKNVDLHTWSCTKSERCNYYGY